MATLKLLNSTLYHSSLPKPDRSSNLSTANYTQIPSWISLKSNISPTKNSAQRIGNLENVHLVSLCKRDRLNEAYEFLLEMHRGDIFVSHQSYKHLLESCSKSRSLDFGRLIHRRLGQTPPGFVTNWVLRMYCECGSLSDARKVFDEMPERTLGSWVIIISAYANLGLRKNALDLYLMMQTSDLKANPSIYISLLKTLLNIEIGKQLHCQVIKAGYTNDVAMDTSICNMYVKCGDLESAELQFDRMIEKNVVSWTSMMVGFTQSNRYEDALRCFKGMVDENVDLDEFVFSITLKVCAALNDRRMGAQAHGLVVKLGLETEVSVGTPLVDFYVKCGDVELASRAFECISKPNDVSWSAILRGYADIGEFEKCANIFKSLRREGITLNEFMYTSIFHVCSSLADFTFGSQAHADAIKRGLVSSLYGESAMIAMYAKSGRLDYAYRVFESINEPDTVAWTAMLAGYAHHGNAADTLGLFNQMEASGVQMNSVTFIAVLTACSHAGLVKEAKEYLQSLSSKQGVEPTIDHYNCMIDTYARAGLLNEAFDLITTMPFEPDAMSWKTLLGGCLIHRKYDELGKTAAEKLLKLDPNDTAAYILLFNLHASLGRWAEAASIRKLMAERDLKKETGCSWITENGRAHRFIVGDRHHPKTDEIYTKLEELGFAEHDKGEMEPLTEEDVAKILAERREQMLVHSERLAIAYGLISTSGDFPIVVFKNLRACKNCHDFAKHVSFVTGRKIVVRDSNRFHHFIGGECSCGDFW